MKRLSLIAINTLLLCGIALAQNAQAPKAPPTMGQVFDRSIKNVESEFVPAADAMPEDKYSFAPTNGEFKGVRTFADEVRHVAATNWDIAGAILGEKPPVDTQGPNDSGPANLKSKDEIMKYLKDSFAYLHKAVSTIDANNATVAIKAPWGPGNTTRLSMALLAFGHPFDHYGQMVEYLRMNGIIPPASRPQPK